MKISALIVTNRPWFLPWWARQLTKQTRRPDEIILVTNAPEGYMRIARHAPEHLDGIPLLSYCVEPEPWVSLGYLRQKALDWASGDIVAWFDDDDWYHPRRLELSAPAIEQDYADMSCFPLTHLFFAREGVLLEDPAISGYALPSTMWRRSATTKSFFPHVGATEERLWIHPMIHGTVDASGKRTPPIIPPHRHNYVSQYIEALGAVGGIVVVHGHNTWSYRLGHLRILSGPATKWPSRPPRDVSAEDWNWSDLFLRDSFAMGSPK